MPTIRIATAISAIVATLTLTTALATAAPASNCPAGAADCKASSIAMPGSPLSLNQFIKHPRPAKAAATTATTRSAQRAGKTGARVAARGASAMASARRPDSPPQETAGETTPQPVETAQEPAESRETNGVAITSADQVNELDAAADTVQVVAANEVNELDLAADATPVSTVTADTATVQNAAPAPAPADNVWVGKLLAALGGLVAVASVARMLIA
jgi:hypothetical protein